VKNKYNEQIFKRVARSIDKILPIVAFIGFVSAVAIYFSSIPNIFALMDLVVGLIFLGVFVKRQAIATEIKVTIILICSIGVGALSFVDGGFASAGLTLFMLSNVLAVLMLEEKNSFWVSFTTLLIFILLWALTLTGIIKGDLKANSVQWMIHFITYILYLLFLHSSVIIMRRFLVENISRLEESVENTYDLAYFDQLTGLPNQILFKDEVDKRLNDGFEGGYLILFNLKNLRVINSIYGDAFGDEVLMKVAETMTSLIRESELVARVSGNEYALWVDALTGKPVEEELDYIKHSFYEALVECDLRRHIEFYNSYIYVGKDVKHIGSLYQKAFLAMTYTKKHDLNHFVAYDDELEEIVIREEVLRERLKVAIADQSFDVYYQAKTDALNHCVVGVEALARWSHPELGHVSPAVFVPIIETLGLAKEFGELIFSKVLNDYSEICRKYGEGISVSVNISPSQLCAPGFEGFIRETIIEAGVQADKVILEITEEIIIQGMEVVTQVLKELKDIGVKISLDDFGTGYSSLNYLMNLDIDELKIDKTFVDQICTNPKTEIMMETMIGLVKAYKLNVIAEGVESKEQCDKLIGMGCYHIQGYYFSKPAPI